MLDDYSCAASLTRSGSYHRVKFEFNHVALRSSNEGRIESESITADFNLDGLGSCFEGEKQSD